MIPMSLLVWDVQLLILLPRIVIRHIGLIVLLPKKLWCLLVVVSTISQIFMGLPIVIVVEAALPIVSLLVWLLPNCIHFLIFEPGGIGQWHDWLPNRLHTT